MVFPGGGHSTGQVPGVRDSAWLIPELPPVAAAQEGKLAHREVFGNQSG